MVNKYPGACVICGASVPANGGECTKNGRRWTVAHSNCVKSGHRRVDSIVIGGNHYTRNKGGRCEDAPCCGCCTI